MYPDLCKLFQEQGYALAVHGSLIRDFDLIAVPWTSNASSPSDVLSELMKNFAVKNSRKARI